MSDTKIKIFKIFYDEATRAYIEPEYLPLDNTQGEAGWFELRPILKFLEENVLEEDTWYGFVSPKFPEKAGLTSAEVWRTIRENSSRDLALFSYDWPSLAIERNPWTQGERRHPGLIACFETFLARRGTPANLRALVTDFDTSVHSNFIVARAEYWHKWREIARAYYDYASESPDLADNQSTRYDGKQEHPLKVFVQERLASWVLLNSEFKVARPDYPRTVRMPPHLLVTDAPFFRFVLRCAERSKFLQRKLGLPKLAIFHWFFSRVAGRIYKQARRQTKI